MWQKNSKGDSMEDFEAWEKLNETIKSLSVEIDCLETMILEHQTGSKERLKKLRQARAAILEQSKAITDRIVVREKAQKKHPPKKFDKRTVWERLQANHK
jgi:hypothetical protein